MRGHELRRKVVSFQDVITDIRDFIIDKSIGEEKTDRAWDILDRIAVDLEDILYIIQRE